MGYNGSMQGGNLQNRQINQIRDFGVKSEFQGQHMVRGVDNLMTGGSTIKNLPKIEPKHPITTTKDMVTRTSF